MKTMSILISILLISLVIKSVVALDIGGCRAYIERSEFDTCDTNPDCNCYHNEGTPICDYCGYDTSTGEWSCIGCQPVDQVVWDSGDAWWGATVPTGDWFATETYCEIDTGGVPKDDCGSRTNIQNQPCYEEYYDSEPTFTCPTCRWIETCDVSAISDPFADPEDLVRCSGMRFECADSLCWPAEPGYRKDAAKLDACPDYEAIWGESGNGLACVRIYEGTWGWVEDWGKWDGNEKKCIICGFEEKDGTWIEVYEDQILGDLERTYKTPAVGDKECESACPDTISYCDELFPYEAGPNGCCFNDCTDGGPVSYIRWDGSRDWLCDDPGLVWRKADENTGKIYYVGGIFDALSNGVSWIECDGDNNVERALKPDGNRDGVTASRLEIEHILNHDYICGVNNESYQPDAWFECCDAAGNCNSADADGVKKKVRTIIWDNVEGIDWLCDDGSPDTYWRKASDNTGKIYNVGNAFDALSNGYSWIECNGDGDEERLGDGITDERFDIRKVNNHEYICGVENSFLDSWYECCDANDNCNSAGSDGKRILSGQTISGDGQTYICCDGKWYNCTGEICCCVDTDCVSYCGGDDRCGDSSGDTLYYNGCLLYTSPSPRD